MTFRTLWTFGRQGQTGAWFTLFILALTVGYGCTEDLAPPFQAPSEETAPAEEAEAPGYVESLPDLIYKNLFHGYSLEECVEILGRAEDETESVYDPGTGEFDQPSITIWRTWHFKDGAVLRLGFISGQLRGKTYTPPEEKPSAQASTAP